VGPKPEFGQSLEEVEEEEEEALNSHSQFLGEQQEDKTLILD
jgi:hypothetical protein